MIDTLAFPDFDSWDSSGQPIIDVIPATYGRPKRKRYGNVSSETTHCRPLDKTSTPAVFSRLREELHDVIWGGGGTNNNETFTYIVKLILCKIYDEQETPPGNHYQFQRLGDEVTPEAPSALTGRMNALYSHAEATYLALPRPSEAPAFDPTRLSSEKLAYVVGRLEALSVTDNVHTGDLLGEFFEQIVSQEFTQTKGQFFTPMKIVRFMLLLCDAVGVADYTMRNVSDYHGRPRLPYVIDPACGSGSFLIEYMKMVTSTLGTEAIRQTLPGRLRDAHSTWFANRGNAWAREHVFGIENNHDLGLASKVNMVLHGDGSMNTWISSGVMSFDAYWLEGRNNVLGTAHRSVAPYEADTNEQFDLVLSNPPFSLKMSPDEMREIKRAFASLASTDSERIFIERWYQLLRDGGLFCCVLPETILDTSSNAGTRLFLYQFFRIRAVVSLPYDAFRPFTSTKTCIVLAEKRSAEDAKRWDKAWSEHSRTRPGARRSELFLGVVEELGWACNPIFMAEPENIGYKRRKGLPDIEKPNDLFREDVHDGGKSRMDTVIGRFRAPDCGPSAQLGFWTDLRRIAARETLRLDPKYRWLWDYGEGLAHGNRERALPLRGILEVVKLRQVPKGELGRERILIDLDCVESRQAVLREGVPWVDTIGSQKVEFDGCEMAFSKLEPYLGKVLMNPCKDAVGSTEWVGLKRTADISLVFVTYLLMLPELCEAYRRLQSGKRHARLDPDEFLDLLVEIPSIVDIEYIEREVNDGRATILALQKELEERRAIIDRLFRPT
ncbi:MAG: N-6 DNA methylase [Spirochaetaceae bacterium]|nr:N-6 DNA methylase [Spirochaetaceae bacterium]